MIIVYVQYKVSSVIPNKYVVDAYSSIKAMENVG